MTVLSDQPGVVERRLGNPVELTVSGLPVPSSAVGPLSIRRGRGAPEERFDPAQLTATLYADALDELPTVGDQLDVVLSQQLLTRLGLWSAPRGTTSRTNLSPNPRAAVSTFGWYAWARSIGSGANLASALPTVQVPADVSPVAARALRITWGTASEDTLVQEDRPYPTRPGRTYTFSGWWLRQAAGDLALRVQAVEAATNESANAGEGLGPTLAESAPPPSRVGSWERTSVTFVARSSATSLVLRPVTPPASGQVSWWVGTLVEQADAVGPYFDGATAPPNTTWTGPAHGSVSTYSPGTATGVEARPRFVGGRVVDVKLDPAARPRPLVRLRAAGQLSRIGPRPILDPFVNWPVERPDQRATRAFTEGFQHYRAAYVPPVVDAAAPTLPELTADGLPIARVFDQLSDAVGGELWERRDGLLAYLPGARSTRAPQVVLTAAEVVDRPAWSQQLGGLATRVAATWPGPFGDETVEVFDERAEWDPGIGPHPVRLSVPVTTEDAARARALDLVARRSRPSWRIDAVRLDLRRLTDARLVEVLRLDSNALVALDGLPTAAPSPAPRLWVEGLSEDITRDGWTWSLDVSAYGLSAAPVTVSEVADVVLVQDVPDHVTPTNSVGYELPHPAYPRS